MNKKERDARYRMRSSLQRMIKRIEKFQHIYRYKDPPHPYFELLKKAKETLAIIFVDASARSQDWRAKRNNLKYQRDAIKLLIKQNVPAKKIVKDFNVTIRGVYLLSKELKKERSNLQKQGACTPLPGCPKKRTSGHPRGS